MSCIRMRGWVSAGVLYNNGGGGESAGVLYNDEGVSFSWCPVQ